MKTNKLLQLLRDNAKPENSAAPKIRAEAGDGCVEIYIYDVIDPIWGASAADLIAALTAAAGQPVCLHINSPGGDVFEARAMAAAVASYAGEVEACIDGVCASAATYLALAAGSVCMVDGALLMVHNSWTMAMGDCNALRQTADLVEKIDGTIAKDYMRKTKCSAAQVKAWMDAETWFTADEALAAGFIDEIESNTQAGDMTEDDAMPEKMAARWNLAAYDNAPKPEPTPDPAAAEAARITAQALAQIQINRNRMRLLVPI
jgi:ATP-dependent Clp protease protease subunit